MHFAFSLPQFSLQFVAVLLMLGILSLLIIVHECGHFFVARLFGFQTPIFGFGLPFFGPSWTLGKKWGTEFKLHALLIGGYVAIPELGDESAEQSFGVALKPFRKFPIWQRMLVAFAGPASNILFAYLVMILMLMFLGYPAQETFVYSLIKENPIAAQAGIKPEDRILRINGQLTDSPSDAVSLISGHKNEEVKIQVKRNVNGENQILTLAMKTNDAGKVGMSLVAKGPITYRKNEIDYSNIPLAAAQKLWKLSAAMVDALGQLVSGLAANIVHGGKNTSGQPVPGFQDLHGVLAIIKIGADIATQDWSQLFLFTVLISMDLAIVNLLPWPGLDGSHIAFMAVEAVRGRPMHERHQGEIVKWGFVSLLLLMALIMVNDVTALISGKLDLKSSSAEKSNDKKTKDEVKPELATPPEQKP